MSNTTSPKQAKNAAYSCLALVLIIIVAAIALSGPTFNQAAYDAAQERMEAAYNTWPELESITCASDCTQEVTYTFSSINPEWSDGDLDDFLTTVSVGFAWHLVRDHGSLGNTTFNFIFKEEQRTVVCEAIGGMEVTCL